VISGKIPSIPGIEHRNGKIRGEIPLMVEFHATNGGKTTNDHHSPQG
jgi:hypothetical protein